MVHRQVIELGGRQLILETGRMAGQANGAVTVQYGESMVLATAVVSKEPREGIDFFPLTVDYEERLYAGGKIPGDYRRREGRPSEAAVLAARLTDRPLRPLFPKGFRNDVQIVITTLSFDQENDPSTLGTIAASAALHISDIPWAGPVAACRIGLLDGELVVNPTESQLEASRLDLVVAATADAVMMVEAGAQEVDEDVMLQAVRLAHESLQPVLRAQEELRDALGRPKREFRVHEVPAAVREAVEAELEGRIRQALNTADKGTREQALSALTDEVVTKLSATYDAADIVQIIEERIKAEVRRQILDDDLRPDGRKSVEIRPITCEVGLLPRAHGSALFTRGQTQALSIATLGTVGDAQRIDALAWEDEIKRYLHHYNFPPFSVGEARPLRGPSRRDIGHGHLAERALVPVLPDPDVFPYTIRVVSEILSSNGSTSMASVCGSTLALMDAGAPISAPVAGVAMGLVLGEAGEQGQQYAVLTDIQGMEDALGDMDFKVAGTEKGITALQMDIKVKGITPEIMERALAQAREGRLFILGRMLETIREPRPAISQFAPKMITVRINPDKIGTVIGPGGKTIRKLQEETGTNIDIDDSGLVSIAALSGDGAERAAQMIRDMTEEVEVGKIYLGRITRLLHFGAFAEILPGKEGLIPLSELAEHRITRPEDVVDIGDEVMVMVAEIDSQGRVNLSRRAVIEGVGPEEVLSRKQPMAFGGRGGPGGPGMPRRGPGGPAPVGAFGGRGGPGGPASPAGPGGPGGPGRRMGRR